MSIFFTCNDKIYKEGTPVITPDNRSLRYGDGLFETLKTINGKIQLHDYHFERLFAGMKTLQFTTPQHFTAAYLEHKISELCKKNQHNNFARVRLMVFRGDGGLYDAENVPNYIIQTWSIEQAKELNSNGLIIDVYHEAKKHCDKFANIKSNNFLPYIMAALHAKQLKVNDCIVLNNFDRIADTTIANIFIIKEDIIYTPPLKEGCVAGVTRRLIIEKFSSKFKIIEKQLSIEELHNADEVFLTNSIKGIRWVKQFRESSYNNITVKKIHALLIKTIY
jgi:branched-chain amino acid aminotransferase